MMSGGPMMGGMMMGGGPPGMAMGGAQMMGGAQGMFGMGMGGMAPMMGMAAVPGGAAAAAPPKKKAKPKKKKKKGKVKPKTKMKPLHWTKYNMKKAKGTIFEEMDDEEVRDIVFADGELDHFVELFGVPKKAKKKKKKKGGDKGGDGKKKKKKKEALKTFADGAKSQRIGIALGKFKVDPYVARIEILQLKRDRLSLDKVVALKQSMPDEEDVKAIEENLAADGGDASNWDRVEKFWYVMYNLPKAAGRLRVLEYSLTLDENITYTKGQIQLVIDALALIAENENFSTVLKVILALGNYMNGGTSKGQSYGFPLDFLQSIGGTKSTKGTTLLMYITEVVAKHYPPAMDWVSEMEVIKLPAQMDPEDFQKEIDEITKPFSEIRKIIGDVRVLDNDNGDHTTNVFTLEGPSGQEDKVKEFYLGGFKTSEMKSALPKGVEIEFECICNSISDAIPEDADGDVKADDGGDDKDIMSYKCRAECYRPDAADQALKFIQSNPEVKIEDSSFILTESDTIYEDKFIEIMEEFEVDANDKLDALAQIMTDLSHLKEKTCKMFGMKPTTEWKEFAANIIIFMEEWQKARKQIAKLEAELKKKEKEEARKKKKKKRKGKLKDLMKQRGNAEDLKKKGVLKSTKDVKKAQASRSDAETLLSNHLAVLNKQSRLKEKRKRTASFFMPSNRDGMFNRRERMHTYSEDLAKELDRAGKRRSLTAASATVILGEEKTIGTTRSRRTVANTMGRKRRQTTNHLHESTDLSREEWIAKLLGKEPPPPEEPQNLNIVPDVSKKRKNKKKKKKNKNKKVTVRQTDFNSNGDKPRRKIPRGRGTVFVDPNAIPVEDMPTAPELEKKLSLVLTPPVGKSHLIAGMEPDGLGDEMVIDHTPSKKRISHMGAKFQSKKTRAELETALAEIFKVTSVKLRGNKKRHITVKDGRLWWLKNEAMAMGVCNGEAPAKADKHSIVLRLVTSVEVGIGQGSVFSMVEEEVNPDVCVSIYSEDRNLNIMMEGGKPQRDRWVHNLRQLVKLIQSDVAV